VGNLRNDAEEVILDRFKSAKGLVVAEIVRVMRKKKMSNAELARRLGVSAQYVGQVLKRKRNVTIETLEEIAHHLGMAWCWTMVNIDVYPAVASYLKLVQKNFQEGVDTRPLAS